MANTETPPLQRVLLISPNATLTKDLQPYLESHVGLGPVRFLNAYPTQERAAGEVGSANLVLLDVTSKREVAVELLQALGRSSNPPRVVALLADNDPDLILRCLRAGAVEFLIHPFTGEQLESAFSKLARQQPADGTTGTSPAKTLAVMPAKGACGATTIASNLALQWKRSVPSSRVLLIDMDPLTGNLSFLLKVKSTYSFLDVLVRAHELDHDLWRPLVTQVNGVDVMLAPELMPEGVHDLRDPSPILEYARHAYDVVILDCGGVYGDWNLNAAKAATEVLLITTNELPALQAAQRALSYLDTNRVGRWKLRLIVNRYLLDVGLSREVIGTALHTEVFDALPSDYEAVQRALMDGKPIPAASAFGKGVQQLVGKLGGKVEASKPAESAKKSGGLSNLFGGLFSKAK
jgi:pilus assembly protein CpaE